MYKPVFSFDKRGSSEYNFVIKEAEAKILYCLLKGLGLKHIEDVVALSKATIRKWIGILYEKTKLKFRSHAALVSWMIENKIYHKLKKWITKTTDLEAKIAKLK